MRHFPCFFLIIGLGGFFSAPSGKCERPESGPVVLEYDLKEESVLTVVIDSKDGSRVRNLVNAEKFPAGPLKIYWDGLDEGVVRPAAGRAGYEFSRRLVIPGEYVAKAVTSKGLTAKYEFTVYPNTGNPPWLTEDILGGWLADHSAPSAVLHIPANKAPGGKDTVIVASGVAESGHGLAWLDLDGKKLAGFRWIGGTWTGATHLTRDLGPSAFEDVYAYTAMGWNADDNKEAPELRVMALTTNSKDNSLRGKSGAPTDYFFRQILKVPVEAAKVAGGRARATVRGLAARDNTVLVVLDGADELWIIDVSREPSGKSDAGRIVAKIPARGLSDICFDAKGNLLGIMGNEVQIFPFPMEGGMLGEGRTLVTGLESPSRLSVGPDESIFVSDRGSSHQVKVFNPDGTPRAVVGQGGEPRAGRYHPLGLNDPAGTTVDSQGRLWVAEDNNGPKRVSVWKPDGSLVHSFIGPARYGGSGFLDPRDRSRMYVADRSVLMEFALDWDKGSSELTAVPYRIMPETPPFFFDDRTEAPQNVLYAGGKRYLTNCYSSAPASAGRCITLWSQGEDLALKPVGVFAMGTNWPLMYRDEFLEALPPEVVKRKKNPRTGEMEVFRIDALIVWTDRDGDGVPIPPEVSNLPLQNEELIFSINIDQTPSLWIVTNRRVLQIPASSDSAEFVKFNLQEARTAIEEKRASVPSSELLHASDGVNVISAGPIIGYRPDGTRLWTYHSLWPGVHASHRSPRQPEFPGQLLGTTRVLGWPQSVKEKGLGEVWAVNSNYAVMYFLTTDGFFLGTIGGFPPENPAWRMPRLERGSDLTHVNFIGEHFWPTFTQSSDGNYYMVAGKHHSSIVRIDGLETLHRLPDQPILFTTSQAEEASRLIRETDNSPDPASRDLEVPVFADRKKTTATETDWKNVPWVTLEAQRIAFGNFQLGELFPWTEAAIAVHGDRLHIAVRTYSPNLLDNTAESSPLLFKTGGGIDLQMGLDPAADPDRRDPVAGDIRLVLAQGPDDKAVATLYEQKSRREHPSPESFSSPWRTVKFDHVEDVSPQVEIAKEKSSISIRNSRGVEKQMPQEFWEISIPLDELGVEPGLHTELKADIGVLIGAAGETVQRHYWSNPVGGLVNDVPGESILTPGSWGVWRFKKQ